MMAQILFLKVVELHSKLFGLALDPQLEQCTNDFQEVWLLPPVAADAANAKSVP
jgi:hypothetical protein